MTQDEVVALLKVISHYDKRPASAEELAAWSMSAHLAGWTLAEAVAAVHEHFAFSTEYLKQGHVTKIVQARRDANRAGAAPPYKALPAAEPASEEVRASAMAAAREVFSRFPQFRDIGRLPWSRRTARPRTTAEDARRREEARDELERVRRRRTGEAS